MQPLPIDPLLPRLVSSLRETPRLVLEAPPGAGKTTRVPQALLQAFGSDAGEIVVLEPRRLAARMAAARVAEELGDKLGGIAGYQVRFEDVTSRTTRIRFLTEGILTRKLAGGSTLPEVHTVILDEFHERHIHGDVALAMLRRLQETQRPDLRIAVMSATLDAGPIATYLEAPILRSEGKRFDVAIDYLPAPEDRPLPSLVASALRQLVVDGLEGDVLVFLPGASEIRKSLEHLDKLAQDANLLVLPLHGDLPPAEQDRALRRADRRKVILSTNVAESSVTIDGVVAVIDSGLARVLSHAPWSGISTLKVEKISRASATQRAGRAGRTGPGRCMRLYTKGDHDTRPEHDSPEIRRVDLAQTLLDLAEVDPQRIPWFDPPTPEAERAARELLVQLGALDATGRLTSIGRRMQTFPVHPRQARVLVEAERRGIPEEGATLAALLSERDIRSGSKTRFDGHRQGHHGATERSDILAMLDVFEEAKAMGLQGATFRSLSLDGGATLAVERARQQLHRAAKGAPSVKTALSIEDTLLLCVLAGYPDRVARRLRPGSRAMALAGGGSGELSEQSAVRDAPWMVAVDAEERKGGPVHVRLASEIAPDWLLDLFPDHIDEKQSVRFDAAAEKVEALSAMTYRTLVLDESPLPHPSEEMKRVLVEAAWDAGPHTFAPEDALARFLARARFAAAHAKDLEAPTEATVRQALGLLADGKRSFREMRHESLVDVLKGLCSTHLATIDRLAPEKLTLPGGRTSTLAYEEGKVPWLEVFLQDFFGTLRTPRVADGAVPVVVHLLGPNRRAVQVTSDLEGFWERHYPAIRKELMRKYPRHFWPEDPKSAAPMLRTPKRV